MYRNRLSPAIGLSLTLLAAAACADSATAPDSEAPDSQFTADLANGGAAAVEGDIDLAFASVPGVTLGASDRGACPGGPCDSLTVTRSYKYFDAAGVQQTAFNATTTAVVELIATTAGTVARAQRSGSVNRRRDVRMTRPTAASPERVWNGVGSRSEQWQSRADGVERRYTIAASDTVSGMTIRLPRAQNPYPTAGSVVHNVTVTQTREGASTVSKVTTRRTVATFNGTHLVALQVGTRACTLDLDKAKGERVSCE